MFKHELDKNDKNETESNMEVIEEEIVKCDDTCETLTVDEEEESVNCEFSNMTYTNPSQVYTPSHNDLFKCDKCDFASARK